MPNTKEPKPLTEAQLREIILEALKSTLAEIEQSDLYTDRARAIAGRMKAEAALAEAQREIAERDGLRNGLREAKYGLQHAIRAMRDVCSRLGKVTTGNLAHSAAQCKYYLSYHADGVQDDLDRVIALLNPQREKGGDDDEAL
jgi:hypothetical protein